MKTIEYFDGSKTVIKVVEDDYEPETDWRQKDVTTSIRKSVSMGDIPANKWNKVFKGDKNA